MRGGGHGSRGRLLVQDARGTARRSRRAGKYSETAGTMAKWHITEGRSPSGSGDSRLMAGAGSMKPRTPV